MKKIISLLMLLIVIFCFIGCKKTNNTDKESFFTVEKGREVFLSDESSFDLKNQITFEIPEGYHYSKYVNNEVYIAYSREIESEPEQEDFNIDRYGLFDINGNAVIECKYNNLYFSGNFFFGDYYNDDLEYKNDIYYIDGNKILTTDYVVNLVALSDDFCALYYDEYSQVFDKNGVYYFKDGNKMSRNIYYSICDDYLFGYDTVGGDWFIWQTVINNSSDVPYGFVVLKKIFEGENSLFTVSYLGNYKFLVVETSSVTDNYDYYEVINGTTYYLKQKTSIYNILDDTQTTYKSDYPILSIVNHYSPTLTLEQKNNLNIRKGYSQVNAGIIDENGERTSYRFFVIDDKGNFVIRYPENMNPTAMRFIDGYGFASGAGEGFTASLYYMNCDLVWVKNDREYYGQSYADGRYVLYSSFANGLCYGVLNSDGEIVVDFEYAYISMFVNNLAFFRKADGTVGIMDVNGETVKIIDDFVSGSNTTSFGVYEFEQEGKRGIKTFDGSVLISAEYDSIAYIGKHNGKFVIVMRLGENESFYGFDI